MAVRKPSPEEKVARHLSSMVICMVTLCNRSSVKSTRSYVVPCRKRASDALPKSDGQQEDRFACPLPSHCRRRFLATKPHLFLTDYRKMTAITGSVPPSPREKALVREESDIKKQSLAGCARIGNHCFPIQKRFDRITRLGEQCLPYTYREKPCRTYKNV